VLTSRLSENKKLTIAAVVGDRGWAHFWEVHFLPRWLPLLLGLGLGVFLALLIVSDAWPFPIPVVLAVPVVILFLRYPFAAVMIWLLVFPYFVQGSSVADRYAYWIIHRGMIPAVLGIVILSDWLRVRKREPVRWGPAELAMVIFVGLAVANILLFARGLQNPVYKFFDRLFVPFCMYWLVRLIAPGEKDLKRFLWVAFVTVVSQSTIGILSWFAPQVLPVHWVHLQGARSVGSLFIPAAYTTTLMFLSLLLFQYAMNRKSRGLRLVVLFTVSLAFFCVFLSSSRGSWLGGLAVLIGLIFIYPRVAIRLTAVLVILAYILSNSVLAGQVDWAEERLTGESGTRSAEWRVTSSRASLAMIEAKPLWGWGYGNYDLYDHRFHTRVGNVAVSHDGTSHNAYLTIMAETGVITFLSYIFPLGWWLMSSIKTWRRLPKDGFWSWPLLAMLWLVVLDHVIVSNFMDMVRASPFGTTMWWMVLGLIGNMVDPYLKRGSIGTPSWIR